MPSSCNCADKYDDCVDDLLMEYSRKISCELCKPETNCNKDIEERIEFLYNFLGPNKIERKEVVAQLPNICKDLLLKCKGKVYSRRTKLKLSIIKSMTYD